MFSNVGTLDQCKEWIEYWISLPTCRKYEHTYTLYPKDPNILQDQKPIAAFERYTPAARVGPDRKMERSDFLREAFRFGILARRCAKAGSI